MPKGLISKGISFSCVLLLLAGCGTSQGGGVSVKTYIDDRARVDQDITGNAGYLTGSPPPLEERKKTRKMFVLEVTKELKAEEIPDMPRPSASSSVSNLPPYQPPAVRRVPEIVIPPIDSIPASPPAETTFEEYTIEKNDTLQKISKKYYDSYSKWPRIYEANKDVIPDPNNIKPGVRIRVPLN